MLKTLLFAYLFLTLAVAVLPQSKPETGNKDSTLMDAHEPNKAFPYGRLNSNGPPQTSQFSFMIGIFDCVDQVQDGVLP